MKTKITKRIFAVLLTAVMLLSVAPLGGFVGFDLFGTKASAATYGVLEYEIENGEVTIIGCDPDVSGEVTIPSTIDGYPVASIGIYAFMDCVGLTNIIIPNSVNNIGKYAFSNCTSLMSITIPNSVTSIGEYAFESCGNLDNILVSPNNLYYSNDNYGVLYNKDKTELVKYPEGNTTMAFTIPHSVETIRDAAFALCKNLKSVTIPDNVTSIENRAFYDCTALTSVTIPDSVTDIGDSAFSDCTSLTSITIGNGVASIRSYAFCNTGYYNNDNNWENNVLYIGDYLIDTERDDNGDKLISGEYSIKNGTKVIADWAFYGCNITNIYIPDSVVYIGGAAFECCRNLKEITIPDRVVSIESSTFYECESLSKIIIGNGIKSINSWAFYGCCALTNISIPYGVNTIADNAFCWCESLTSVVIPDSVQSIGDSAFAATGIKSITIPSSVKEIGNWAFSQCWSLTEINYNAVEVTDFDWSSDVFYDAGTSGTGIKVTFGNNVKKVPARLFMRCFELSSVTIGNSVTSIGEEAFYACNNLTSITIPNSVKTIGSDAFCICNNLTKTNYIGTVEQWCKINFEGFYSNPVYYSNNLYINNTLLTNIEIPNTISVINDYAFLNLKSLTSATIPNSVTRIGDFAFNGCANLSNIIIPDSVTSIGGGAFEDCSSLESIIIPDGVTSIGDRSFSDCSKLTSFTISKSVTSIGDSALGYFFLEGNYDNYEGRRKIPDFKIYCYADSAGLDYAIENEFDYEIIGVPTPHTHTLATEEVAATCTVDGYIRTYCSGCNETISNEVLPATNHSWSEWTITVEPTKTTEGQKERTCSKCGEKEYGSIPCLPATYTVEFYDGDVLLGSKHLSVGESSTLSYGTVPTKDGFIFDGWSSIKNGPALYPDGTPIENLSTTDGAVVKYYAVWNVASVDSTLTDEDTGIEIDIPANTYSGDVTLQVKEVISGSSFNIIDRIENNLQSKVYSIETLVNGEETQPNGFVTVKLPIPEGFDPRSCKLYYVNVEEDRAETVSFTVEGDYIVFSTNHFSHWAIVEIEPVVESIEIENYPSNTTYTYKKDCSTNGMKVVAKYSDGSTKDVTNEVNVRDFGTGEKGDHTATVEFEGKTVTFNYSVKYAWWQWIIIIVLFGFIWY